MIHHKMLDVASSRALICVINDSVLRLTSQHPEPFRNLTAARRRNTSFSTEQKRLLIGGLEIQWLVGAIFICEAGLTESHCCTLAPNSGLNV